MWQLAIETEKLFDATVVDLDVSINYLPDGMDPLPTIFDYVETMRISLWDTAFFREFAVDKGVHKNHNIDKQLNFKSAMRRVFYRYFKYVLFPAQAISKSPTFFANYLDMESEECMFTEGIMKSWDPIHFEKCGWYLDCPLKTPPTFDIALRDSIQPAIKGATIVAPTIMDEDVPKKPKKTKSKPKRPILLLHDSDDDVPVQSSLNNLVDTGPSSSNIEAMFLASKRQKTTPTPTLDMPPKLRGMMNILAPLLANHTSSNLILNDSFVRIIEDKKQTCTFRAPYNDIVAFLSKVSSFYFIFLIFFYVFLKIIRNSSCYFIFCFELSSSFKNYNFCILSL
jgi:hypothetical protein